MSLLDQYEALLTEYDKILNLSKMILVELKKGGAESNIVPLLEQKKIASEAITYLTEKLTAVKISSKNDPNLKNLPEVKSLLERITEKAKLIQEVEEKIQNFLQDDDRQSQ
jgi:hypothetical protein